MDDAAQQVFVITSSKLEQLDPHRAREFLFAVAVRVASNARRADRRRREIGDEALAQLEHSSPNPEEVLERRRNLALLDRILHGMPVELGVVLVLCEIEEMPRTEVSKLLGL